MPGDSGLGSPGDPSHQQPDFGELAKERGRRHCWRAPALRGPLVLRSDVLCALKALRARLVASPRSTKAHSLSALLTPLAPVWFDVVVHRLALIAVPGPCLAFLLPAGLPGWTPNCSACGHSAEQCALAAASDCILSLTGRSKWRSQRAQRWLAAPASCWAAPSRWSRLTRALSLPWQRSEPRPWLQEGSRAYPDRRQLCRCAAAEQWCEQQAAAAARSPRRSPLQPRSLMVPACSAAQACSCCGQRSLDTHSSLPPTRSVASPRTTVVPAFAPSFQQSASLWSSPHSCSQVSLSFRSLHLLHPPPGSPLLCRRRPQCATCTSWRSWWAWAWTTA